MPNLSPQVAGALMNQRQPRSSLHGADIQTGKAHPTYEHPEISGQGQYNVGSVKSAMAWRSPGLLPLNETTLGTFYKF